jgi:hypothetical protein
MLGNSWVTDRLAVYQEGFGTMELLAYYRDSPATGRGGL